jgi:hypothetical protein
MKLVVRLAPVLLLLLFLGSPAVHVCKVGWLDRIEIAGQAFADAGKAVELGWPDLRGLDYRTGKASEKLQAADRTTVRIPGFMIPLEDNDKLVAEFLLVPYPLACIHVPAPPPNQIVHVKMDKGKKAAVTWYEPIWAQGRLEIKNTKSIYTEASFLMTGFSIEPYQYKKN